MSETWNHTCALYCIIFNMNRDQKKHPRPLEAGEIHPYASGGRRGRRDGVSQDRFHAAAIREAERRQGRSR